MPHEPVDNDVFTPVSGWPAKFANAFRGVALGVAGQSSFLIHVPAAALVVAMAIWFNVSAIEWCLLLLCIATVLIAELLNSAMERLAKAVTTERHEHIRGALDIASGSVLIASLFAASVGLIILAPKLMSVLGGP